MHTYHRSIRGTQRAHILVFLPLAPVTIFHSEAGIDFLSIIEFTLFPDLKILKWLSITLKRNTVIFFLLQLVCLAPAYYSEFILYHLPLHHSAMATLDFLILNMMSSYIAKSHLVIVLSPPLIFFLNISSTENLLSSPS